jgi:DNA-binding IclR family transcriptional regulator
LTGSGSISATGIAKRIRLSPRTLVGILDRLESKGLIQRNRSADDRLGVGRFAPLSFFASLQTAFVEIVDNFCARHFGTEIPPEKALAAPQIGPGASARGGDHPKC